MTAQSVPTRAFNPFPPVDVFWRICSRRLLKTLQRKEIFENIVTKEEIAQNEQFFLLPQCFRLLVIGYPLNYRDFLFFVKICPKSSAAELCMWERGVKVKQMRQLKRMNRYFLFNIILEVFCFRKNVKLLDISVMLIKSSKFYMLLNAI